MTCWNKYFKFDSDSLYQGAPKHKTRWTTCCNLCSVLCHNKGGVFCRGISVIGCRDAVAYVHLPEDDPEEENRGTYCH